MSDKEASTYLSGIHEINVVCADLIESVEDKSSDGFTRARVIFKNGYQLSIIRGEYSYGGREGLFEIAPYTKQGDMDGDLFDEKDQGDDVLGFLDADEVNYYIKKIGEMPT